MSIESDFFSRLVPDRDLLAEGNVPFDGKAWRLSGDILDGRFHVELMIPVSGEVRGSVIEAEVGDEYLPLRAAGAKGAFVTAVRSAYLAFLETVAGRYCTARYFASEQANRLCEWIWQSYGERPDVPFRREKGFSVVRNKDNRKWYALFGEKERSKLGLSGSGKKTFVDLKADKEEVEALAGMKGFMPAYHMNRKTWIGVLLDDSVDDALIEDFIRSSRSATEETIEDKDAYWRRR